MNDIYNGSLVLIISALSNILLWFSLKYFKSKRNISTATYMVLQFGLVWLSVLALACLYLYGPSKIGEKNRVAFLPDLKSLQVQDIALIVISVVVAIVGFYLVIEYFTNMKSGVSKFVPIRQALAIIILALIGVFYFKEKLNKMLISGLIVILVGFVMMFIGRYFQE